MVPEQIQLISGLGNVPVDWNVLEADEISTKITKGTTPPKSDVSNTGEIPFLRVNNLSFNGTLDASSTFIYVSKSAHNNFLARSKAYPGDILMNIVGPPLGKTSLLKDDFPEYNMNQAIVFYRLKSTMVDNKFFLSFLNSSKAQDWLQSRSKKTSGQQNLTIQICKELPVPIPPLPEQKKIAQILSTWDKAITTTEQLLANSQQQKKALMQQLLTGKKCLLDKNGARFSREWEATSLSKMGKIVSGGTPDTNTKEFWGGEIQWLTPTDVTALKSRFVSKTFRTISDLGVKNSSATLLPKGSLMVCTRATIGALAISTTDICTNQGFKNIIPSKDFDVEFIYYLLSFFSKELLRKASGSTFLELSKKDFEKIEMLCPSLKEQQKIAAVLSTADQEISVLQQKLDTLKQEKRALMQQLLTGKRRVKIDDKEFA
ncbi:MAG: restriction endonuclease subunit S [Thalassolituus oleivorans]|nr:restriction endonuclease subunit S [Thalassolituus oleivorans]